MSIDILRARPRESNASIAGFLALRSQARIVTVETPTAIDENIMFCEYEDGTSDDLEEIVLYEDVFGFTLGLNTYGTIHSLKNRTTVRNIDSYFNQLNKFFNSEFFRPNFR